MDIATLVGIILGTICVVYSIVSDGSLMDFINVPSIFIVVGGSIASILVSHRLAEILTMAKVAINAFTSKEVEFKSLIMFFVELSQKSRKEGLLSLEADIEKSDDKFIKNAMQMVVDGIEPEVIKELMEMEIVNMQERHKKGQTVFGNFGNMFPAWGMIGTLIGLVNLLKSLDDPSKIGPAMAVALLTTLYGSLLANFICIPIKSKLKIKSDEEVQQKEMIIEGVLSIQSGENPKITESKLKLFLSPATRDSAGSAVESEG